MPGGQPTKYKPEYCALLKEHMKKGFSYESFAGLVSVSKQTIYDWEKVNPEFLDAKKEAFGLCQLFWEGKGIEGLFSTSTANGRGGTDSKSMNSSVWIFNMKNRFNWKDKREEAITIDMKTPIYGKLTDKPD